MYNVYCTKNLIYNKEPYSCVFIPSGRQTLMNKKVLI